MNLRSRFHENFHSQSNVSRDTASCHEPVPHNLPPFSDQMDILECHNNALTDLIPQSHQGNEDDDSGPELIMADDTKRAREQQTVKDHKVPKQTKEWMERAAKRR